MKLSGNTLPLSFKLSFRSQYHEIHCFNKLIIKIEDVAKNSTEPILLLGATGSGKTKLARKIYELKLERGQIKKDEKSERFIEVNCSTIRGDGAMSALFGHIQGAFTDAKKMRKGYLV